MKQEHRCTVCNKHIYTKHTHWGTRSGLYLEDDQIVINKVEPRCKEHVNDVTFQKRPFYT